jgi:succinate dehydrogenase / fumarate reductase flavoprotein subunit
MLMDRHRTQLARLRTLDGAVQRALVGELLAAIWERAAVVRGAAGLQRGLEHIAAIRHQAASSRAGASDLPEVLNLRSMLQSAPATVRAAQPRTECREAHQRSDYAESDPAWQCTIRVRPHEAENGSSPGLVLTTAELPPPSEAIAAMLEEAPVEQAGRVLE